MCGNGDSARGEAAPELLEPLQLDAISDQDVDETLRRSLKTFHAVRRRLFLRYDEGIKLSETMKYSVTAEMVALQIAERVRILWPGTDTFPGVKTCIDMCGGAGGNAIAFARTGFKTVYVDLSLENLQDAVNNSHIYNQFSIEFLCADALKVNLLELSPDPTSTFIFASPEWGGPHYKDIEVFDVDTCRPSVREMICHWRSQGFFKIGIFLPRNVNLDQLAYLGARRVDYMRQKKSCPGVVAWWDEKGAGDEPFLRHLRDLT